MMSKVLCTNCDKVMRVQNGAAIVKHGLRHAEVIQTHLDRKAKLHKQIDEAKKALVDVTSTSSDKAEALQISLKAMEEEHRNVVADPNSPFLDIHNWRQNLSPEALLQQVIGSCFMPVTLGDKRPREDEDEAASATTGTTSSSSAVVKNYQRGMMLQVVMASMPWVFDPTADPLLLRRHMTITVLGRDDSSKRYKVFVHSDDLQIEKKEKDGDDKDVSLLIDDLVRRFSPKESANLKGRTRMMSLLDGTDCTADNKGLADFATNFVKASRKASTGSISSLAEGTKPPSIDIGVLCSPPSGFVLSVQPLVPPTVVRTPLRIPSLSNSFMIGLHTCGDLGSNICRMFSRSEAPLLLLVSCCWHALTPSGFPLSAVAQSAPTPVRANALSLMLATQPLDMLGQSGGDEHLGSLRLLFFRSLFSLLWTRLGHTIWTEVVQTPAGMCKYHIAFLHAFEQEKPHLDRSFLRSLAKDKKTISFVEMCTRIRDKYLSTPAMMEAIMTNVMARIGVDGGDDEDVGVRGGLVVSRLAASLHKHLAESGNIGDNTEAGAGTATTTASSSSSTTTTTMKYPPFISQAAAVNEDYLVSYFIPFVGFTVLRMWMSHVMEGYLLVDRILYLAEEEEKKQHIPKGVAGRYNRTAFSLTPLFDGALSPRMYAIMGLRQQQ